MDLLVGEWEYLGKMTEASLHPDFDLYDIPTWVRGVGRGVQYILPDDSDGRDTVLGQ